MKKSLYGVYFILLFSLVIGCSRSSSPSSINPTPVVSENITSPKPSDIPKESSAIISLPVPEISLEVYHTRLLSEYFFSQPQALTDEKVDIIGSGFGIKVDFGVPMDEDSLRKNVKLEGPLNDRFQFIYPYSEENKGFLMLNLPQVEPGDEFTLILSKDLTSKDGILLGNDIKKTIHIKADDTHMAVYLKNVKEYEGLDVMEMAKDFWNSDDKLHLTTIPKTFELSFSQPVDGAAVQAYMESELPENLTHNFSWKDSQHCELTLSGFIPDQEVLISFYEDRPGFDKFNVDTLRFIAVEPVELYEWDIATGSKKLINTFEDIAYMPLRCNSYNNYFFQGIYGRAYIYNALKDRVYPSHKSHFGFLGETESIAFLDDKHFIGMEKGTLLSINAEDLSTFELFSLEKDNWIQEIALSPDHTMVAFTQTNIDDQGNEQALLQVRSLDGKALYKMDKPLKPLSMHPIIGVIRLNWLNGDTLVFLDGKKVMALSVKTGELKVLADECSDLLAVYNNTMVLYRYDNRNQGRFFLYRNGEESLINHADEEHLNRCILVNSALVYTPYNSNSQKEEIIALDLETKKKNVLTQGVLVGTSPDRNKLYFVNRFEYFVYTP